MKPKSAKTKKRKQAGQIRAFAVDACSAGSFGKTLEEIGRQMQAQASAYALRVGLMRGSMNAVAQILSNSADSWTKMAEGLRYDEPRGIRHAMDVHVNLLRDLVDELHRPGETKYSPLYSLNANAEPGPRQDGAETSP